MEGKNKKLSLMDCLHSGVVSLYGYREKLLPDILASKDAGRVSVFRKKAQKTDVGQKFGKRKAESGSYANLSDIQMSEADVCFLDGEALRTLVIKFPTHPYYVLGRLAARKGWLLGFPGLLRNLFIGRIKVNGIINLPIGGKNQRWIVLQKTGEYQGGPAFLSSDVGVKGFLEYL